MRSSISVKMRRFFIGMHPFQVSVILYLKRRQSARRKREIICPEFEESCHIHAFALPAVFPERQRGEAVAFMELFREGELRLVTAP